MTNEQTEEAFLQAGGTREFKPVFGDVLRGIWASTINPQRDGYYVKTVRNTGRVNRGTFYQLTDGKGRTWEYPVESSVLIARSTVQALELARLSTPQAGGGVT